MALCLFGLDFVVMKIGVGMCGQGDEGLQAIADDFGGNVLRHGLLGQSADVLQVEPVLGPFERLSNKN